MATAFSTIVSYLPQLSSLECVLQTAVLVFWTGNWMALQDLCYYCPFWGFLESLNARITLAVQCSVVITY